MRNQKSPELNRRQFIKRAAFVVSASRFECGGFGVVRMQHGRPIPGSRRMARPATTRIIPPGESRIISETGAGRAADYLRDDLQA